MAVIELGSDPSSAFAHLPVVIGMVVVSWFFSRCGWQPQRATQQDAFITLIVVITWAMISTFVL